MLIANILNEFEQKFVEAHLPIEPTIRVLCKECHRKYDRGTKEKILATNRISVKEENAIIENLIRNQMNKSKALKIEYNNHLSSISYANTILSNIIIAHGLWLQPFNDKFENDLHIILNDYWSKKLYMFRLP